MLGLNQSDPVRLTRRSPVSRTNKWNWGVIVVSDRGDLYLPGCLDNVAANLPESEVLVVNDQGHKLGMAGAVRCGMSMAFDAGWEHVLWVEEDFRFNRRPPLIAMRTVLDRSPQCAQVVLKRQPWSVEEAQAGGIIEMNPHDYLDSPYDDVHWTTHTRIFSLNPCLIPRHIFALGYPNGNEAEQTTRLVDRGYHFAMYGKRQDPPLVDHVGHEHAAGWRL